jgi:2-polyprenyl-6-methoxyphenol hydroxylase-like FAD-dependent oxidoreductase
MDRQVLRAILLTGLKDRVHYNKTATAVGHDLMLRFRDGTTAQADVVVGADGIRSALRRQIAPDAEPTDTTSAGIYGRTPLRQAGHSVIPQALHKSGVLAIGTEPGRAFFFTTMEFSKSPDDDYVMWGLVLNRDEMPRTVDSTALQSLASGFHPLVRRLIDTANHDATVLSTFAVGTRPTRWPLPRATLIGDAVHAMPPFGAHGGNTALRDAALLGHNLIQAHNGTISWESAIATYQTEMPPYAFKAVDSAAGQLRRLTNANRLQKWLIQQFLPRLHRVTVPEPR